MSNQQQPQQQTQNNKEKHPMLDPTACKDLKDRHDQCFYKWYSNSFLKGNTSAECQEEWEEYQVCIKDKLKAWNLEYLLEKNKELQQKNNNK
ncbi:hypothetical protein PPL_05630 [Heterostelium album PN500]|uniref:Uncharacterized protein n=1 Tax=Heterostelium pallidum (strain ATCC 26659 / Pp 5 / PN500) TaxID=670386 RepID=D3BAQ1_HETP5|nr:hypothetical protein PPL_05630 [Heterostelium album PN500]EFA81638.1 hypothetical protein PPL_05630 [Heterostelium album PN500]|eukprot:XP_020433755.1 hypothetical protein PPL_05630 [Heterostelium album PN500]